MILVPPPLEDAEVEAVRGPGIFLAEVLYGDEAVDGDGVGPRVGEWCVVAGGDRLSVEREENRCVREVRGGSF